MDLKRESGPCSESHLGTDWGLWMEKTAETKNKRMKESLMERTTEMTMETTMSLKM
jgi:hypothetical protein